jgi:hypothetical protein
LSTFYLIALGGVGVVILAALFDALVAVSRKPQWGSARGRHLVPVVTTDRRGEGLAFVGAERRHDRVSAHASLNSQESAQESAEQNAEDHRRAA